MENWQSTALSWTVFLGLTGAVYVYYQKNHDSNKRQGGRALTREAPATVQPSSRRKPEKRSKARDERSASASKRTNNATGSPRRDAGAAAQKSRAPAQPSALSQELNTPASPETYPDEEPDDKQWAEQLAAAKRGVTLTSSSAAGQKSKTQAKKERRQQERGQESADAESSRTADGVAVSGAAAPSAANVDDMLEARAPPPSVMRITGEEKPKQAARVKEAAEKETKKQRQHRRRAEEERAQREQDEKDRKIILERQRRTAREARGEPAQNGLVSAQQPAKSAWSTSAGNGSAVSPANGGAAPAGGLLDTFDRDTASSASSNELHTSSTTPATAASTVAPDLPSEEAQLEMLSEMNGWNEVTKAKKGKKKTQPASAAASDIGDSQPVKSEPASKIDSIPTSSLVNANGAGMRATNKAPAPSNNAFAALESTPSLASFAKGHPEDSDWAVE